MVWFQAVLVDSTDVTVWHKISKLALSLHQYSLARHAYEQVRTVATLGKKKNAFPLYIYGGSSDDLSMSQCMIMPN